MDEDYAHVAARKGSAPKSPSRASFVGLVVATLVFGLLLAVAAVQTDRSRPALEEERANLIERINNRRESLEGLRAQTSDLASEVNALQRQVTARGERVEALDNQVVRLGVAAGTQAVTGPGVEITVDDSTDPTAGHQGQVLDTDLQILVNGLWQAGAEAISINGERIGTRTSIRGAAGAITVNFDSLPRPYVVSAIGNPDTLEARFFETMAAETWINFENNFGMRFETVTRQSLTIPARGTGQLRYATDTPEGSQ